jgi:hypothetical protein
VGYLVVGWVLGPCTRRDKFDKIGRLGYLVVGCPYAAALGGINFIGLGGWDI